MNDVTQQSNNCQNHPEGCRQSENRICIRYFENKRDSLKTYRLIDHLFCPKFTFAFNIVSLKRVRYNILLRCHKTSPEGNWWCNKHVVALKVFPQDKWLPNKTKLGMLL